MQKGLQVAIEVPMGVIRTANRAWPTLTEMAKVGNISTKSDLQVILSSFVCYSIVHLHRLPSYTLICHHLPSFTIRDHYFLFSLSETPSEIAAECKVR